MPVNYEEELTEVVTITPATETDPAVTEIQIKNRRSDVAIDIPAVLHRTELNVSDENLSKEGKELFSTIADYEEQIKNRRSDVVLSDTIGTMLKRSELNIPDENASAHSDQATGNKSSSEVYQPSLLKNIANTLGFPSADPATNVYETISSENVLEDYINREEKSITGNDLAMFLYSLVPYQLGKAAEIVGTIVQSIASFGDNVANATVRQMATYRAAMAALSYISYFTMEELTLSFAATPFTLGFLSQITAIQTKDMGNSIKFQKGNLLKFEFPESWDPTDQKKNILGKNKVIGEQQYDIFVNPKSEKLFSKVFNIIGYGIENPNIEYKGIVSGATPPEGSFGTDVSILEAYRKKMEICMNAYNKPCEDMMTLLIESTKTAKNKVSVGYIYVYPTLQDTTESGIKKFKIPFQFNPMLSESGQTANYQGSQSLHRLGQAFSYVYTEGQTLTLETEYLMLSDGKPNTTERKTVDGKDWKPHKGPQDDFYAAWTPSIVQSVESALRSLVLPLARTNDTNDIKFHKPPMVKIVMGSKQDATAVDTVLQKGLYSLLMHPIGTTGKFYHKTYIVTNVTINREQDNPYHIDGEAVTTHGFKVTMNLTEIDHNYISGAPDFGSYYASYKLDSDRYTGSQS